ncbi:fibronectin type III domain-containing protein, partial [Actinoplanes philippinensis]|uniref:fibronectin type III domain-containing protein n=1 Tax=Actinoplanes philippinensis TaxID=35752 RepID=UPI0033FC12AD
MAGCAAVAAVLAGAWAGTPATAAEDTVDVVVDGDDVRAGNVHGLPYKGLGLISANSTSNLLMDYKAEQPARYWQLIGVLFGGEHPLINHVKIEMGSDTNNSTGADAATMRTATELADASRSPGFQLAADAKTVNPDLKVSILRWTMPYWVQTAWNAGTGRDEMYRWYKETILDAYEKYGYLVDYVNPDTNETTSPDISFLKYYKNALVTDTDFADPRYGIPASEQAAVGTAYRRIKIVASDENQTKNIGPALLDDQSLFEIVDAVGYHYNTDDRYDGATTGNTYEPYTKLATVRDKEVWYSEGVGSFGFTDYRVNNTEGPGGASTGIGGLQSALDLANRSVKGYHRSKRTHYLFQPAIGSFYEGAQYSHKELLSARDPWSGSIHYDAAIFVMQHFTRFATTGWENDTNTAGIWRTVPEASYSGVSGTENLDGSNGAPSYLTLADPQRRDFSTIAVNDSDQIKMYRINVDNMDLGDDPVVNVWETRAAHYMRRTATLRPDGDGYYTYPVQPRSIVTFTTVDTSAGEPLPPTLPRTVLDTDATGRNHDTGDTILYADDFAYAEEGDVRVGDTTRPYLASRGGEPRYLVDQTGAWQVGDDMLYQLMDQSMKDTAAWNRTTPNTLVGDFRWHNYTASVDVSFPDPAGGSAGIGVRQQTGMTADSAAYQLRITRAGAWTFARHGTTIATGARPAAGGYTLAVEAKGATVTAFVDGAAVHTFTDPTPELAGRVNLSSDFHRTGFDNLKVEKIKGFAPYAVSLVDNMDSTVGYTGTWSHKAASGDAMDWHRTTSTSSTAGSTVTVGFTGTGLDLIGANTGTATIDVTVDGLPLAAGAPTGSTGKRQSPYTLRGLADGPHTATVTLRSGTLVLDALTAISGDVDGPVDTTPIRQALTAAGSPAPGDWSPPTWAVFAATRDQANAALSGLPGLDTIGVAQIAARLTAAADGLRPADVTGTRRDLGLAGAVRTGGDLPATVVIDGRAHEVTWTAASRATPRTAYTTVTVEGWTNDAYADGKRQAFTAAYETVPSSLIYYIDAGLAAGQSSPQYQAVAGLVVNTAADQVSAGADQWGHVDDGITVKGGTDPADKFSTGYWAGSNKTIRYRLPLDPGQYVLTAGFTEWWAQTRPMSQTVTAGAATVTGTPISLNATTTRATGTVSFTVTTPTVVTYTVARTGSQDPVISWLAVHRTTPDAPARVTAVAGDTTAQVSWDAPGSDGGSPITGYTVTAAPGGRGCTATNAGGCRVSGLDNGTAYTFTVVAHTAAGTSPASAPSAPVTPFWLPTAATVTGPAEVTPGRQVTLNAAITPGQAVQDVTWQSSDPSVAAVSAGGVVTGAGYGTALITATSVAAPRITASHRVTVVPADWSPATVYTTGALVRHDGHTYQAQWWTLGQTPGASAWGAWAPRTTALAPMVIGTGSLPVIARNLPRYDSSHGT